MAASRDSLRPDRPPMWDRPPGWPSWCVSLAIHLCLFFAVLTSLRPPDVNGAADQPRREVGIALKQMTDEGPLFESPDLNNSAQAVANEVASNRNPALAALPDATDIPSSESALPRLPSLGPRDFGDDQRPDIGQMSSGGATSKIVGSKANTSIFGIEGTGTRFVYVFDRSISMAGPPLRAAKRQLVASLEPLDSVHQFQVIFFNHEPQAWDLTGGQNRIAFATDANKLMAKKFIDGVIATGGTFRRTALQMALRLRPDVIFFLTDTDDPMTPNDLEEMIRRARRDSIAINTIEYGSGSASKGDNFLIQLARATQGRYVYVDTTRLGR